jgi:hypothetical protein
MISAQLHIGIVIGSTPDGRFGEQPAHWIHGIATRRAMVDDVVWWAKALKFARGTA